MLSLEGECQHDWVVCGTQSANDEFNGTVVLPFSYDIVDIAREMLGNLFYDLHSTLFVVSVLRELCSLLRSWCRYFSCGVSAVPVL